MDVTVTSLRAELAGWIKRAKDGEDVVVTDRGRPVVRLSPVGGTPLIDRLVAEGVIDPTPPTPKSSARDAVRVTASGPVADLVEELRR